MTAPDAKGASNASAYRAGAEMPKPYQPVVLDLFAGPGGWDQGALPLGIHPVGIEWDMAACQTAMKAGHVRVRADVAQLPTEPMVGKVVGLIASPPCQAWSMAGKRKVASASWRWPGLSSEARHDDFARK